MTWMYRLEYKHFEILEFFRFFEAIIIVTSSSARHCQWNFEEKTVD